MKYTYVKEYTIIIYSYCIPLNRVVVKNVFFFLVYLRCIKTKIIYFFISMQFFQTRTIINLHK